MSSPGTGSPKRSWCAISGMTRDEIVGLTWYSPDWALRILQDAGVSEAGSAP
jgi:hypothetical protein